MGSFVLLVLAAILGATAYKVLAVRYGLRWYGIGKFCAALAVALVVFVITLNFADDILGKAGGDNGWAERGSVRALFVVAFTVVFGLWAYFAYRDRNPE
jgi:hypothetical protein